MFKKSNKQNIRRRRDTEEEYSDEIVTDSNSIKEKSSKAAELSFSKKEKSKKTKVKKVSLLSFDDEEDDGTAVKLKKSSRSRRIAKEIKKRSQLEKEAVSTPPGQNGNKQEVEKIASVHVFQSQKTKDSATTKPINFTSGESALPNLSSGAIPTPSMIHAARKQREMLRKFGSEYISAEDTQRYKDSNTSRLVREDDNDSSDEGVMEMKGIEKSSSTFSNAYAANKSDEENEKTNHEDNADEEVNRWEEELIKKGINTQANQSSNSLNANITNCQDNIYHSYSNNFYDQSQIDNEKNTYRRMEAKNNISFLVIKKRLEEHLNNLNQRNHSHIIEMEQLQLETGECEDMSKHLGDIKSVSSEYQFFQEMRQYVKDLSGCLRENIRVITSLEQNAQALWKNQSDRLILRRRQDIQDESIQVNSNKLNSEKNSNNESEFIQRVREREARRTRRRAARQIKQTNTNHFDGLSTDDEETTMDIAQFDSELQRIKSSCSTVFEDVLDDFCVIKNILQRFDDWRKKHNASYNDAYIALCIPKLLFPFVRQKLILWNPLQLSTIHFEEEKWFKDLAMFGLELFSKDDEENSSNNLDDTKVISSVVEKVLSVKLLYFISNVWDPMSIQQTVKLSLMLKELARDYPFMMGDNHQCQKLAQALCKRLQTAVDNDVFIPLLPPSTLDSPTHLFLERQTWTAIKLFKNTMMLEGILSYKSLCEIAFDSILNRYILLALQTSIMNITCLYKCQRIVDSIPKHWLNVHSDISTYLSSLARFLVHFAQSIKASELINSKTMLKQIKTMLLVIGAKDALQQL